MIDDKTLIPLRSMLDQENTAAIVNHAGYKIFRNFKFMLRDEKTPSVSIRRDGLIKDFGGDFSGDVISLLMEYHGLSFPEAVEYVAICLGVEL